MEDYIVVRSADGNVVEVDINEDGSVSLESLRSEFGPSVTALKYTNTTTGRYRIVRASSGHFSPPRDGWGNREYMVSCSTDQLAMSPVPGGVNSGTKGIISHPLIIKEDPEAEQPADQPEKCNTRTLKGSNKENNVPELNKKELLNKMGTSAIARTAVFQWNKMNTAIRIVVHQTTFKGSGGMLKCEGTSKEEALENQRLRECIATHDSVKQHFGTFYLEDNSGKITLDTVKAFSHVRNVLNDLRRKKEQPDKQIETNAEKGQELNDKVDCSYVALREKRLNKSVQNTTTGTKTDAKQRKRAVAKRVKANSGHNDETDEHEGQCEPETDPRCQYEREIDAKRYETKVLLHDTVLGGKPKLMEGDAVVVARTWFPRGTKCSLDTIKTECEEHGLSPLPPAKRKCTMLREALIHFGNELVDNMLVTLKRPAGITCEDVERN